MRLRQQQRSQMTDSDTARRARLEEIIREGRRVRSNVTQLHSSPQRNTFTSNLSYSSPYNSQTTIASPYSSSIHQPHFQPTHQTPQQSPQHHHQAPPPPQYSNYAPYPIATPQQQQQQQQYHQQQPQQPQQQQQQHHQYPTQPIHFESKETKQALDQLKESKANHLITETKMNQRIESADAEVLRIKQAMSTLANEADVRIQQLIATVKMQQEQIKTMVLQRTTSEAEMNQRAMLENRAATTRESETYRTLIKQIEQKHLSEKNNYETEMKSKIITIETNMTTKFNEKLRIENETMVGLHKREMNQCIQHCRSKERNLIHKTNEMIKQIVHEFDLHRKDTNAMRNTANCLKRDMNQMKNTFATDLKYSLSTITHWSTGAVRILENQISLQKEQMIKNENVQSKKISYDPVKDQEYFDKLKMRVRLTNQ